MIIFREVQTPIGAMMLFATEMGVLKFAFACENFDQISKSLAKRYHTSICSDRGVLDDVVASVDAYFSKRIQSIYCRVDLSLASGFRRLVLEKLNYVGYGKVISYSDLAKVAGSPQAARSVGSACATNPVPIILPCHRVIKADGSHGGFAGGTAAKRFLIELESGA